MRWFIKLFQQLLTPTAKRFRTALKNPQLTQQRVQQDICDRLIASEYGKFLGIRSIADWQKIPIVDYDDIEHWIYPQELGISPPHPPNLGGTNLSPPKIGGKRESGETHLWIYRQELGISPPNPPNLGGTNLSPPNVEGKGESSETHLWIYRQELGISPPHPPNLGGTNLSPPNVEGKGESSETHLSPPKIEGKGESPKTTLSPPRIGGSGGPSPLTPEPILFYEKTSGSRGAAKLIPYTKSLRRSFNQMFCVWAHDLIANGPKFSTGKIYFCISPQFADTANSNSPSLQDDSEYLDRWLRFLLHPFLVSPPNLHRLTTAEEFKRQLCLALLQEERLEIISIWSPSFLKIHLDYIQTHREELRRSLKLSPERDRLLCQPEIPWTKLWPELKLISCWDSVSAADPADFLRRLFPEVLVQGKGLLATEAPMTIPLISAQGYVPVVDEVFFEFEDEFGEIFHLHQLQAGGEYGIVISQKSGLYRYRIGDRVRVSHFYLNTPCLEFLGRDRTISDLVGEKLSEAFLGDALRHLPMEGNTFQTLVPATTPSAHYILLLDNANLPASAIAHKLEHYLCKSPHYRHARLLGQLSSIRVLVSPQIPEILTARKIISGKKWGEIKHPLLSNTPIDEESLHILSKLCRDDSARNK